MVFRSDRLISLGAFARRTEATHTEAAKSEPETLLARTSPTRRWFVRSLGGAAVATMLPDQAAQAGGLVQDVEDAARCQSAGGTIGSFVHEGQTHYWCFMPQHDDDCKRRMNDNEAYHNFKKNQCEGKEKIICNELLRQGLFTREDVATCHQDALARLTPAHVRGYHVWALPVVRWMRRSRGATLVWHFLARRRTNHVRWLQGKRTQRDRLGHLLCMTGEPLCWVLGRMVREQNWQALYQTAK